MPFFQPTGKHACLAMGMWIKKIKNAVLQVRIPPQVMNQAGKRALPFASLTVEAALALPLFLFALVALLMPLKMMEANRRVEAVLESACQDASQFAYMAWEKEKAGGGEVAQDMGIKAYALAKILGDKDLRLIKGISFSRSKILEDGEMIDLVMDYQMKLPFPVLRLSSLPMTARSARRGWIGREGGRKGGGPGQAEGDQVVYVGKGSTRYHHLRSCHYIFNHVTQVALAQIGDYRNGSGGKYRPCRRCGEAAQGSAWVYIMPSGDSYHGDQYCSAIIAYVEAVPLSSVRHMGPCSYCSN